MMPPVVIDLQSTDDARDVVHRAVQALAEGKLVGFPTETVYTIAASTMQPAAGERLSALKGGLDALSAQPGELALGVKGIGEALDYIPEMSALGKRLARRCWPGPVTLVFDSGHRESLIRRLSPRVQDVVAPGAQLGLRAPAHPLIQEVLKLLVGPVLLTSANRPGETEPQTAQEVVRTLTDEVALILDDGPCRFGQPASVVRIENCQYGVVRPGVVSEQNLKRLASQILVFVCTGNTCRSPMAELLCRKLLAEKYGCPLEKLEDHGVIILSAGIAAMMGGRPAQEAVDVMRDDFGLDLSGHTSQPLTEQMIRQADHLFVMTHSHQQAILAEFPEAADRTRLLSRGERDVSDPIGGPLELYRRCAEQIEAALRGWVEELTT